MTEKREEKIEEKSNEDEDDDENSCKSFVFDDEDSDVNP